MERLRQRADFLAAATGAKVHVTGFVLQMRERNDRRPPRVGFTVSKKVGNAVERNRVRRRLREVVRRSASDRLKTGCDYVLIGRRAAIALPFDRLAEDFKGALGRVGNMKAQPSR
ncbi:MAG: ribonuclease P protein component [Xanthobacteraceae bacterium]